MVTRSLGERYAGGQGAKVEPLAQLVGNLAEQGGNNALPLPAGRRPAP